ncbi:MarR family transcriptional regulator [bacterium]|jgi:DNA-binding MarR family transcriptional regulator|nr:MarR family transcriptional regulator [bacterium]
MGAIDNDVALVTGLYRTTNAAIRELDHRLVRDHQVTFVQAVTLLAIDSFDRPQPHMVADYLSQQSQTVTGVIDRLERAGHVSRRRDLDDRRAVRLELTRSGRELAESVGKALAAQTRAVLSRVAPQVKQRLEAALDDIDESLRANHGDYPIE